MLRLGTTRKKKSKFRIKQAIYIKDIFPSRVKVLKEKKKVFFHCFSRGFHGFCLFQIASALAALHSVFWEACAGHQCRHGLLDNTAILYANAGLLFYPYF